MKKIFKSLSLLFLTVPLLAGCGFLKDDTKKGTGIKSIVQEVDEKGDYYIVITYDDKSMKPVSIPLPKGEDGEDGIGIDRIEYNTDEDTHITTIKIFFEHDAYDPVEFTISPGRVIDGTNLVPEIDEETGEPTGNKILTFIYRTGDVYEESDPILIEKGDTGNGIESITSEDGADNKIIVTVIMTNGDESKFEVPAGNGIDYINVQQEDSEDGMTSEYVLYIHYTNGNVERVPFPRAATWESVNEKPQNSHGYDGDFAFDTENDIIYQKQNGQWVPIVEFDTGAQECTITLNKNASDARFATVQDSYPIVVNKGQTLYQVHKLLPTPIRDGYTFGGWCPYSEYTVNHGIFDELTVVTCDITLYAYWY